MGPSQSAQKSFEPPLGPQSRAPVDLSSLPPVSQQANQDLTLDKSLRWVEQERFLRIISEIEKSKPLSEETALKLIAPLMELAHDGNVKEYLFKGLRTGEPQLFNIDGVRAAVFEGLKDQLSDIQVARVFVEELERYPSNQKACSVVCQAFEQSGPVEHAECVKRIAKLFTSKDASIQRILGNFTPDLGNEMDSELVSDLIKSTTKDYVQGRTPSALSLKILSLSGSKRATSHLIRMATQDIRGFEEKESTTAQDFFAFGSFLGTFAGSWTGTSLVAGLFLSNTPSLLIGLAAGVASMFAFVKFCDYLDPIYQRLGRTRTNHDAAIASIRSLADIRSGTDGLSALAKLAQDTQPEIRAAAIESISRSNPRCSSEFLIKAFKSPCGALRKRALELLVERKAPEVAAILKAAREDPDRETQLLAYRFSGSNPDKLKV